MSFWRHIGVFILLLCLLLRTFRNGRFNRSTFLCLWSQSDCAALPQRTSCLESSWRLACAGGSTACTLLATLVLQSAGCFCGNIERRPLARLPSSSPCSWVPARLGVCGRIAKVLEGHGHICAYNDVWAVGLAFTVVLAFFSSGAICVKRNSVFMRATNLCTNWTGK